MTAAHLALSGQTKERIRAGWASELQVPIAALTCENRSIVPREGLTVVISLQLENSTVVVCPPILEPILSNLSNDELLDMVTLKYILKSFDPNPIGTANISYADHNTLVTRAGLVKAHQSGPDEISNILTKCSDLEQLESGLSKMPFHFSVESPSGKSVSLSGFEDWYGEIAQLGVLTIPQERGRGYGFIVASAAAFAALEQNLIPQWRSRIDNIPSKQLGLQLGFNHLGLQLALEVSVS
jgi:hypothetical protein